MISFEIPGYFARSDAENIKNKIEGKTFFKFKIEYASLAGNCVVRVSSETPGYTVQEMRETFYNYVLIKI